MNALILEKSHSETSTLILTPTLSLALAMVLTLRMVEVTRDHEYYVRGVEKVS